MSETATVETPASTPSAAGGSRSSSAPASAPAGTNVTHGTAGSALVAAASKMMEEEGAASSTAQPTGAPSGDTSNPAGTTTGQPTAATPQGGNGQAQPSGTEPARNTELEGRFRNVARNAQAKTLEALGLKGVSYDQIPEVSRQVQMGLRMLSDLKRDPRDLYRRLGAQLGEMDGENGTETPLKFPDGSLVAEDGKTRVYSQEQILKEVVPSLEKAITQKLLSNGTLQRVIGFVDDETQRRETEAGERQRKETVSQVLGEMRTMPHFKENEQKIVAAIAALHAANPQTIKARGVAWAVNWAYNRVLNQDVYGPTYRTGVEAEIREEMRKKANGGQQPVTSDAGRTDGKKTELRSVDELAAHMRKLEAAG